MEWERVGEETFWAEDDGTWGPRILAHLKPAKRYRITLEEETRKCCERWRGQDVCTRTLMVGHPKYEKYVIGVRCVPTFCPECGKRL